MENQLLELENNLLIELNRSNNSVTKTNYTCSRCKFITNEKSNEADVLKEFVQALVCLKSNNRDLTITKKSPERWQSLSTNCQIPESSDEEEENLSPEILFGDNNENDRDTGYDTLTFVKEPKEPTKKKPRISLSESSFDFDRRSWLRIILKSFENEKMIRSLIERRIWNDSLSEQAVKVVLDSVVLDFVNSKIEIIKTIVRVINKILQSKELNKYTLWSYHLNVISEFCDNSIEICVETLDFLIVDRLKTINDEEKKSNDNDDYNKLHEMIKNFHVLFYALNVIMKKFDRMVPKEPNTNNNEERLLRVVDWWQDHHRFPATEFRMMDLISKKKRWIDILEEFCEIHLDKFPQFVVKARQFSSNLQQ